MVKKNSMQPIVSNKNLSLSERFLYFFMIYRVVYKERAYDILRRKLLADRRIVSFYR
jgi:hypothetical protein